ncbi:MAG TPA: hypothetical protein VI408_11265 [Gaiellaceae bacterium]
MDRKRVQRMNERERNVGLDADDAAARWLEEHHPAPPPRPSKSASKSKLLHRWRRHD